MRRLLLGLCLLALVVAAGTARATDQSALAVEGSYLLTQDDGFQRILTFDRSGNVTQISDLQTKLGFTVGQGAWTADAPGEVRARIVDFSFEVETGKRTGPVVVDFVLTFSDPVDGRYQKASGSLAGRHFDVGENPLRLDSPSTGEFNKTLDGERITVD